MPYVVIRNLYISPVSCLHDGYVTTLTTAFSHVIIYTRLSPQHPGHCEWRVTGVGCGRNMCTHICVPGGYTVFSPHCIHVHVRLLNSHRIVSCDTSVDHNSLGCNQPVG